MEIVVCTDRNYIMPCGVLLHSICKNCSKIQITFNVVIDESVANSDKDSLLSIVKNTPSIEIIFHTIDGHLFDDFPNLGKDVYISKATYYRLYLTEILPKTMDKVLYLDCDMIVRKDLTDLWNINIEDVAVGVALDGMDGLIQLYNRLEYPIEKGYFNAGMLLINLKFWREKKVLHKSLLFIEHHYDRIVSHDQDVLNYVLQDSKKHVSFTYNFGECFLYEPKMMQFDYFKYKNEIDEIIYDPAIVHYTLSKPWRTTCLNPFRTLFYRYRDETQWKGMPLEKPNRTIKSIGKGILRKLGLIKEEINPFRKIDFELK